jgi:predicted RNA-binding Zn-ribbon protein involved in translation (DUF1610 family)
MSANPKPISCSGCGTQVATEESLQFMVVPENGIRCPNCGKVVVRGSKARW